MEISNSLIQKNKSKKEIKKEITSVYLFVFYSLITFNFCGRTRSPVKKLVI